MTRAVGIDLGTTFSVAACLEDGRPVVIPNAEGQRLTPSVVAFTREGKPLVGQLAKRQAVANSVKTVASIKRLMGSNYKVCIDGRGYTPQEISSLILRKVRADAEDYLGEKVEAAVITVPAYFNDSQRQATKEAGIMAGLDVIRIINEPTAAALAYGLDREEVHTILVCDLGGGTFDVSILDLGEGIFEVKAVSGDTWLGGDDYDQRLAEYLAQGYQKQYAATDLRQDKVAWQKLKEAAEKAKIELSQAATTYIQLPFIYTGTNGPRHLEAVLTQNKFQEITRDLLERMVAPTLQALSDASLRTEDIDRVILVGGATRMPAVQNLIRTLMGKEPYKDINPDEVVAMGAAIQAGVLSGQIKKVALLDITPLSLGIETQGRLFARIIPRNTPVPTSEGRIFTTAADNQTAVNIHVLQGERELALHNMSLGEFQLEGIPPLPRGTPRIEVTFEIDVDGILHVSAKDLLTENEQIIRITSPRELSRDEIERVIAEAELNLEEDMKMRERAQAGLQADNMLSAAERVMEQAAVTCSNAELEELQKSILGVKTALASGDSNEIRLATEGLGRWLRAVYRDIENGYQTSHEGNLDAASVEAD